jgi:single-strand DNA-binding protein
MFNNCTFVGRLTRDPEVKYTTSSGIAVCNFTLAVDRPFLNAEKKREADFIRITVWRKLAENCANHLGKGRLVLVNGRLQIDSYTDKEGVKRQSANIVANEVRFLDWSKDKKSDKKAPSETPDISSNLGPSIDWPEDPPF